MWSAVSSSSGRRIDFKDKLLSAHEPDLHVIVRGKVGREVEFGNTLFIAETQSRFISDYQLYQERAPSDAKRLIASLQRMDSSSVEQAIRRSRQRPRLRYQSRDRKTERQ